MNELKQNWFKIFLLVIILLALNFIIKKNFEKKIEFRVFEECISVVSDPASNWMTKKNTIDYCKKEAFK